MSLFSLTLAFSAGMIVALGISNIVGESPPPTKKHADDWETRSWSIYLEPTSDMSVYRGIYEDGGRTKYNVTGRGIGNTLENLAEKVKET